MKTIVVYESKTGFTEQYANWISKELDCVCKSMKQVQKEELATYDRVIFGGWVMGNMIVGLDKVRDLSNLFAIFAVGSTPAYEEVIATIQEQNNVKELPFYYLVGGFHFEKLAFPIKIMLKTLRKSVLKKENRSRQDEFMAQMLGTSFDHTDKTQIMPLVEYCKA